MRTGPRPESQPPFLGGRDLEKHLGPRPIPQQGRGGDSFRVWVFLGAGPRACTWAFRTRFLGGAPTAHLGPSLLSSGLLYAVGRVVGPFEERNGATLLLVLEPG